jgi:hypothetical protein
MTGIITYDRIYRVAIGFVIIYIIVALAFGASARKGKGKTKDRQSIIPAGLLAQASLAYSQLAEGSKAEVYFTKVRPRAACETYLLQNSSPEGEEGDIIFQSCHASITIDGEFFLRCVRSSQDE